MPTLDPQIAVSLDHAISRAGERAFPGSPGGEAVGGIGLEPEYFPIFLGCDGRPYGRVPLRDPSGRGVLEIIDSLACEEPNLGSRSGGPIGPWEYDLGASGRLTFEPGAQVEHSTSVYENAAAALDDVQRVLELLRSAFRQQGAVLAAAGLDVWHDIDTVSQQLPFGRYTAQAAYYDRRGAWGRVMMRHTASLQINLDLGPDGVWQERWLAANLISPLITASFACSPGPDAVSARARAWQELDPTRSGYPRLLVEDSGTDPREQWAEAALAADVMLFRLGEGRWDPGSPGFSFERWIREGHSEHGWPTSADLDYHLTTLFFEVRSRGFFELRAGEAVPDRIRPAQVVVATALMYDDRARGALLERLGDHLTRLPELWQRAAIHGVNDRELGDLAALAWEEALRGAERMSSGYFSDGDLVATRRFLEQYTFRGRSPSDVLREHHEEDPARSLAWAASES
jgi:glutamate--cysteine ligase